MPLILLIISLTALLATYAGYPLVMEWLGKHRMRPWRRDESLRPPVTMVVAVYNEERVLAGKIENFRQIEYPGGELTLLVGSDGSSDGTHAILAQAAESDQRIRWNEFPRGGKLRTINRLMEEVDTPYVVFCDANTMYQPDAVQKLMQHFADESVGAVCGNLVLRSSGDSVGGAGERTYWTYENVIKSAEGRYWTTLGATGGIYAIRRSAFERQPEDTQVADDLLLPLRITATGMRVVYESEAIAVESTSPSMREEFRRKVRVALTSFNCIPHLIRLWPRYPLRVQCMLFFHKFLRWLGPFFLLTAAVSIILLSDQSWSLYALLYPMLAFIALTLLGWLAESAGRRLGVFSLPYYFIAINAALLLAWITLPFRRPPPTWEPSVREGE